jgi:hypothetical protein
MQLLGDAGPLPFGGELSNTLSKGLTIARNVSSGCWTRNPADRQLAYDPRQLAEGSSPDHPMGVT